MEITMRLGTLLLLLLFNITVAQEKSLRVTKQIEFFDILQDQETTAELNLYIPPQNLPINEHLVFIIGGAYVGADQYSSIADRLASMGYVVAITKYAAVNPENITSEEFPLISPFSTEEFNCSIQLVESSHFSVVGEALQQLMEGSIAELEDVEFADFVALGHSFGGAMSLQFSIKQADLSRLGITGQLLPTETKINYWDKYLKGIITFEGSQVQPEQLQEDISWLYIASPYYFENLTCVDQIEIDETNHFSINDFQGEKQIVACTSPQPEQARFETSQQKWDEGLNLMAQVIDLYIQARLDGRSDAYEQFIQLFENERVLELSLVEEC
eukprot:TRINITY_DN11006_c0_g2_i3.p1 TRINITY_DN11006_c0_g2~~TRINITY_DN11006_c0_g2_i3.p1  ORF type:complete len:366 (-),score=29.36 TRINITY_DN11006_c0_g2_i3:723-1709(-)